MSEPTDERTPTTEADELTSMQELHVYLLGAVAGGLPQKVADSVGNFAEGIEAEARARLLGLDWLYIFDKASGGDGNGTHGQDRFGFNARIKAALTRNSEDDWDPRIPGEPGMRDR